MNTIDHLQQIIDSSNHIVFFTGAGVSCDSGIPDFRSVDGLYNQKYAYPPEMILSHSFFMKDPLEFYRFYHDKMLYPNALPNITHNFIAKLEAMHKCDGVITQNIDGLHQKAGCKKVVELHGSVHRNYCTSCHKFYDLDYMIKHDGIVLCSCGHIVKPDVVLYEEALKEKDLDEALNLITNADCLIVCGTSLKVYPAAGLVRYYQHDKLVVINKDSTDYDQYADLVINDSLSNVLSQIKL